MFWQSKFLKNSLQNSKNITWRYIRRNFWRKLRTNSSRNCHRNFRRNFRTHSWKKKMQEKLPKEFPGKLFSNFFTKDVPEKKSRKNLSRPSRMILNLIELLKESWKNIRKISGRNPKNIWKESWTNNWRNSWKSYINNFKKKSSEILKDDIWKTSLEALLEKSQDEFLN